MQEPKSTSNSAIGEVVAGRFRITGTVGKGAMGAVYAAEHTGTGQRVALKFMIVDGEESQEFVARFEQEARVMAGLKHPNTIRIYDFGQSADGAMFMAMELLAGQGLDRVIKENTRQGTTMGEAEAASYGAQILKSLAEAHGQGLVHRDLKPGNVFLTDDGGGEILCKVLDFGIARTSASEMTGSGRLLGTPSYMSPEQWQSSRVDARADLYAVGCILHCCVTGAPPFSGGDNAMALMNKHLHEPPPDPRMRAQVPLSDAFCQVIATALAKDPGARYADARSMRMALEAAVGGAWAGTPATLSPGTPRNLTRPSGAMPAVKVPRLDENATVALQTDPRGQLRPVGGGTLAFEAPQAVTGQGKGKLLAGAVVGVMAIGVVAWLALRGPRPAAPAATAATPASVPTAPTVAPAPAAAAPQPPAPMPTPVLPAPAPALATPRPVLAAPEQPAPTPEPAKATAKPAKAAGAGAKPAAKPTGDKKNGSGLQMVD